MQDYLVIILGYCFRSLNKALPNKLTRYSLQASRRCASNEYSQHVFFFFCFVLFLLLFFIEN